jgi:hypothetical protein
MQSTFIGERGPSDEYPDPIAATAGREKVCDSFIVYESCGLIYAVCISYI